MRRVRAARNVGVTLRHADGRQMQLSPKTINHAIDLLSTILGAAIRDEDLQVQVNPADDRRLRVKVLKKSARDFLEADEVLTLVVAGEVFGKPGQAGDGPGSHRGQAPSRQRAAHVEGDRPTHGRSEAGVIWLYGRHAERRASHSRAVIALLGASGACNTDVCGLRSSTWTSRTARSTSAAQRPSAGCARST